MAELLNPPAGGLSIAERFRAIERQRILAAVLLMAPLLVFLLFFFFAPLAGILVQSAKAPEVPTILWRTAGALEGWNPTELPEEAVFGALVADLRDAYAAKTDRKSVV